MIRRGRFFIDEGEVSAYSYHQPVLLAESIKLLINIKYKTAEGAVIVDGTLGGGGHTASILRNFGGTIFAFDKDPHAIELAKSTFEEEIGKPSPSIVLFNQSFSKAYSICENRGIQPVGILLDLGVSSKQLDTSENGISYRFNSPLDMRFGVCANTELHSNNCANSKPTNINDLTARDILNTYTEDALVAIFRNYGEEPKSGVIARRIVEFRRASSLDTTFDLRSLIEDCTPKIHHYKTLSRIFQALRIEVNQELSELQTTLTDIINILASGGRIVVISYHSLEDRIVKQIFKDNSFVPRANKYLDKKTNRAILNLLTHKPIIPSDDEIKRNPRARSAKMRVAEKN